MLRELLEQGETAAPIDGFFPAMARAPATRVDIG